MPTDNVVPIDAEVARSIARRAVRFRWFVAGLTAVWLGALLPVLLVTPLPPLVPFLVLGALLVLAEHRFVLFGDETSMSGSIIVAIASVFVFIDTAPLAGPMLVASLGGLYFPHMRRRQLALALSNGAGFGLSAFGAAATVLLLSARIPDTWTALAALVLLAVSVDWVLNSAIVGGASAVRGATRVGESVRDQLGSDMDALTLIFAVGALSAASDHAPVPIAVLGISIALAAFEIKLAWHRQRDIEPGPTRDRILNASLVATTVFLICSDPGLGTVAIALLALFLVQATDHLIGVPAAVGFTVCGAIGVPAFALQLPLLVIAAVLLVTAFAAIETTCIMGRVRRAGRRISPWTGFGLLALGPREVLSLALIAAAIAVSAPIYQREIGSPLPIGCALVAIAAVAGTRTHSWKAVPKPR